MRPPTDAFLSYSRKNRDFVRKLHDFLVEQGKDIWLDEEDIPPASEWEKDIAESIDAAYGFVFVVSRQSLASQECAKELDYAIGHGKRIVPIACDDAHPSEARDELRKVNWVLCRDGDDQAAAFAAVLQGLDTDLEWTHESTRLLMRAVEWDGSGQNSSFLLRGSDLREAEQQLAAGASKDPPPTELHSTYILASRHAATRRQRMLLGGVSVALAVAIGLGVLALLQRNDARRATRAATSVALASAANDRIDSHPDQALLLALAAYESRPSGQARGAAVGALEQARALGVGEFLHGDSVVDGLAFAPDERTVAVGSADGSVRLWDVPAHRELVTLRAPGTGGVVSVAFAEHGRLLMAASGSGVVSLWNVGSAEQVGERAFGGTLVAASVTGDGQIVAAADGEGHLSIWNRRAGSLRRLAAPKGTQVSLAFSPDEGTLAYGVAAEVGEGIGQAVVYDAISGDRRGTLANDGHAVTAVSFSRDGSRLATGGTYLVPTKYDTNLPQGEVRLWDMSDLTQAGPTARIDKLVDSVALGPRGATVVAGLDGGTIELVQPAGGRTRPLHPLVEAVTHLALGRGGRTLVAADSGSTGAVVVNLRHPPRLGHVSRGPVFSRWSLAFGAGGRTIAAASDIDAPVGLVDVAAGTIDTPSWLRRDRKAQEVAFSADDRLLAAANSDGSVDVWNAGSHRFVGRIPGYPSRVSALAFDRADELLAAGAQDGSVRIWDVGRRGLVRPVLRVGNPLVGIAFSGRTLVTVGADGAVDFWHPGAPTMQRTLRPFPASGTAAVFSADARTLAYEDTPGRVFVWTLGSSSSAAELSRGTNTVSKLLSTATEVQPALALSADGTTVAVGDDTGMVQLWDVATRTPLGTPVRAATTGVAPPAFSPDGSILATASGPVTVWKGILWHGLGDLRARICTLVPGGFSGSEWQAIAPGIPRPRPCG